MLKLHVLNTTWRVVFISRVVRVCKNEVVNTGSVMERKATKVVRVCENEVVNTQLGHVPSDEDSCKSMWKRGGQQLSQLSKPISSSCMSVWKRGGKHPWFDWLELVRSCKSMWKRGGQHLSQLSKPISSSCKSVLKWGDEHHMTIKVVHADRL